MREHTHARARTQLMCTMKTTEAAAGMATADLLFGGREEDGDGRPPKPRVDQRGREDVSQTPRR